jgi:hypothetical protein
MKRSHADIESGDAEWPLAEWRNYRWHKLRPLMLYVVPHMTQLGLIDVVPSILESLLRLLFERSISHALQHYLDFHRKQPIDRYVVFNFINGYDALAEHLLVSAKQSIYVADGFRVARLRCVGPFDTIKIETTQDLIQCLEYGNETGDYRLYFDYVLERSVTTVKYKMFKVANK